MRGRADPLANFREKYVMDPANGCWLWQAYKLPNGYGHLRYGGRTMLAHRAAWELFRGPIPVGLWVLHRCDVRACVNPDHLFLGTRQDNMDDMVAKGRSASGVRNQHSKLTPDAVREIRRSSGTRDQLAARFGVTGSAIGYVRRRDTWRSA